MCTAKTVLLVLFASTVAMTNAVAADQLSNDELHGLIKEQQQQIKNLESQVEATASQMESTDSSSGHGAKKTSIGGYGELHYNNLNGEDGASNKTELDFHRFVLFFGHEFNKNIRFFSELEVEHSIAGEGKKGEIELEQAYIEMDINQGLGVRTGLMLAPVGIITETHEPPTFYGVERNPVEKNIIPATWWFGGVSLFGKMGSGFSYDVAIHEGLHTPDSYSIRSGRQKTSKAQVKDLAATARIKWTGVPGLEVAGTIQHQSDIRQGEDADEVSANLIEVHTIYNTGPFTIKALYASWDLDGDGPEASGADEQTGWYVEPSYKINEKFGVFARINQYDNKAGISGDTEKKQVDIGLNYWPHPDVVFKIDYLQQNNDDDKDQDGFNLGVGYMF